MRPATIFSILLFFVSACTINDDNRCGKDRVFANETCVLLDSDSNPVPVVDGGADSGDASNGDNSITGLGIPCDSSATCAEYEADYCAKDPSKPTDKGACAISNCTIEPDSCPSSLDLICCKFPVVAQTPNLCITAEQAELLEETYGISCRG